MKKNKKRVCGECPECKAGPESFCFWEMEKGVPEHFKPSLIKAYVSVETIDEITYLEAFEMEEISFDSEFLSWFVSFCVGHKINAAWKTKNIPFFLGAPNFIIALNNKKEWRQ